MDDRNTSGARSRSFPDSPCQVGQEPVTDEHVVRALAGDADTSGAAAGPRCLSGSGPGTPR